MKALFLSNDASIPDIASATRLRMQAYADEVGELHVLMRSNRTRTTTDGSITIHEVKVSKILSLFRLPSQARSLIRKYGIEIVSAQDPFEHGIVSMFAVRGTSAKLHVQIHTDFLSPWFTHGYTKAAFLNHARFCMADVVLPRAHGIRVVAPRLKRSLMTRYGNRIAEPTVIPIAIPEVEGEYKDLATPFPFTLLTLGRLEPEKRFQDVFRALVEVRKTYPDVGLVIAGNGSENKYLRQEARSLGIENNVRFLGMRADVPQLMKAAHVFVQSSAYEGYSRTLVEAAQAHLPIVTTDVGIVGDVLIPNVHVLQARVADALSLAENITKYIESEELRKQMADAAYAAITAHLAEYKNQPAMIAEDLRQVLARNS